MDTIARIDDMASEPPEIVKVSLGDGTVLYIGSLNADEFIEWQETKEKQGDPEAKRNAAALLITRSLVRGPDTGPDGAPLSEIELIAASVRVGTLDMVPKFRKIKVSKSERLLKAIFKLNNINQKDEVEGKNG